MGGGGGDPAENLLNVPEGEEGAEEVMAAADLVLVLVGVTLEVEVESARTAAAGVDLLALSHAGQVKFFFLNYQVRVDRCKSMTQWDYGMGLGVLRPRKKWPKPKVRQNR